MNAPKNIELTPALRPGRTWACALALLLLAASAFAQPLDNLLYSAGTTVE